MASVWTRGCYDDGIHCTQFKNSCDYRNDYVGPVKEILLQLMQLEEDRFIPGYHQNVEKERQKVCNE